MPSVRVDASGAILLPATGMLMAKGKTARELTSEIEQKLAVCCLKQPQVIVMVEETSSLQVTITGAITETGVYNMRGPTTLMNALALAKGPDRTTANLSRIAVYRFNNGQRTGAIFNLKDIRAGKAEDPMIYGGDTIIVDTSSAKSVWRSAVSAVPFMGIFAAF